MSEISEIEIKSMTKEQNYMRGYENGKFDVLDEIKAEIANHLKTMTICDVEKDNGVIVQSELTNRKVVLYDTVLQIIDNYKTDRIVPIILIDKKGEEHDGLMDMRRMLIYLHNIPAETAISLGYTWKSAEGSDKE